MYDVVGDIHGAVDELRELMDVLGYRYSPMGENYVHPEGRQLVFVGDVNDRGPDSIGCYEIVMGLVETGVGHLVQGNHDNKLYRYLKAEHKGGENKVRISHGLQGTLEQLDRRGSAFKNELREFLSRTPYVFETDGLLVCHAAYVEGAETKAAKDFNLYGMVDRKAGYRDDGFPVRLLDWREKYKGTKDIIVGHIVVPEVDIYVTAQGTRIADADTGCCFGGKLSAVRWPEWEVVQVPARRVYWERGKQKVG